MFINMYMNMSCIKMLNQYFCSLNIMFLVSCSYSSSLSKLPTATRMFATFITPTHWQPFESNIFIGFTIVNTTMMFIFSSCILSKTQVLSFSLLIVNSVSQKELKKWKSSGWSVFIEFQVKWLTSCAAVLDANS